MNEITTSQIQQIIDEFESAKQNKEGFIFLPSPKGFDVFTIDAERLKLYLQNEALYQKSKKEQP